MRLYKPERHRFPAQQYVHFCLKIRFMAAQTTGNHDGESESQRVQRYKAYKKWLLLVERRDILLFFEINNHIEILTICALQIDFNWISPHPSGPVAVDLHPHDPRPRGARERREPRGGRPHRDLRQQQLLQHPERLRDADHGDGGGQVCLRRLS